MFAKILIPIPISQLFTYKVPFFLENKINIGHRAIIPLGNRKIQTGIVLFLEKTQPAEIDTKEIKEIIDVPDEYPIFLTPQIKLLEQIAQYYLCTLGEVLHTALPSGFKINSKSIIQINPEIDIYELESYNFNDLETKLIDILALKESISYDELDAQIGIKNPYKTIHSLIDKKIIFLFEQITEKYKPDTLKKIRLSPDYQAKEQITALFEKLKKKEPQTDILLFYVQEIMPHISVENNKKGMKKSKIEEKKLSKAALNTLLKNKIMEEFTEVVSRFPFIEKEQTEIILQDIQQQKLNEIVTAFESKNVVLFHGITGSGKTEIYIHLIQKEIATGKQVLYLLPELALTVQIVQRIRAFFGDIVGIYHSRFSAKEKVEVWKEIINGRFKIIVGTRSSIFLPFHSLSLIIVDEEHDASFKQTEASPHYNARDMAIFLAQEHTAKVLLGSATPSLESFFNAENKKYGLVTLHERFAQATLPTINLINVREEKKNKKMNGNFSNILLEAIQQQLTLKKQCIIFQNKRGYASFVLCNNCGYTVECPHCSVSLTYHIHGQQLKCHYCGHTESLLPTCKKCNSSHIKTVGYGTEKIEENFKVFFPNAKIERLDIDNVKTKNAYQNILSAFQKNELDILIGTQMVSKGLDFANVELAAIIDIDRILFFPDFRSHEKAFQIITQVSGRAGRKSQSGQVYIQTYNPQLHLFQQIKNNDYQNFYKKEIIQRKIYRFPPIVRLIKISFLHTEKKTAQESSFFFTEQIKNKISPENILGPQEPIISKIKNKFRQELFIKIEKKHPSTTIKSFLKNIALELQYNNKYKNTKIVFDVDPY